MRRIAAPFALAVLAAQVAFAQPSPPAMGGPGPQTEPSYDLDGTLADGVPVRGTVAVRRVGRDTVLDARLVGAGLPQQLVVRGERMADGSLRFKLPGTPGLRGALARDGSGTAPRYIYLRRNADGTVSGGGLAEDGTTALGGLHGTRALPAPTPIAPDKAPPAVCEPGPRSGLASVVNGGVVGSKVTGAVRTFVGALWDFYKPGSRRFEELRGDVTPAQTTLLAQRLAANRTPPFSPEVIYAEARTLAKTPEEALRLSFALLVDQGAGQLPLAPIPGIDEDLPRHDKYEHFFGSAILAQRGNGTGSFTVGWLKEVMDGLPGGTGYDQDDLMADALGADFGQRLHCGEVDVDPIRRR